MKVSDQKTEASNQQEVLGRRQV